MNIDNFNPDELVEMAAKSQHFILQAELENGVPLNYLDENGQYVFRYKDGTVLAASMELSFNENWERHKELMRTHE